MAEPRYETAYELGQRIGHTDSVVCTDCGAFVMDAAAHTRFHLELTAHDRNADSNRERGHQRTTADSSARDLLLPHWSPPLSAVAYDYGSEGWGFESLRAR
jgi:hypothetical protein